MDSKYNTPNTDNKCTHGTILGSYCDKCAAPQPTITVHSEDCVVLGTTASYVAVPDDVTELPAVPTTKMIRKIADNCDYLNEQIGVVAYHRRVLLETIEELEAQLAEYKNKPATGLQWIETVDKHNALKKQLASVRPLVHKWRSKPYRSEMSIRLSNELEAAIGEKKDG